MFAALAVQESDVFRVLLRLRVHAGMEEEFERVWAANTAVVACHPANRGQFLAKSATERSVYYISSDWTDERGFRAFENSRDHLEHRSMLHPYRSEGSIVLMHRPSAVAG